MIRTFPPRVIAMGISSGLLRTGIATAHEQRQSLRKAAVLTGLDKQDARQINAKATLAASLLRHTGARPGWMLRRLLVA